MQGGPRETAEDSGRTSRTRADHRRELNEAESSRGPTPTPRSQPDCRKFHPCLSSPHSPVPDTDTPSSRRKKRSPEFYLADGFTSGIIVCSPSSEWLVLPHKALTDIQQSSHSRNPCHKIIPSYPFPPHVSDDQRNILTKLENMSRILSVLSFASPPTPPIVIVSLPKHLTHVPPSALKKHALVSSPKTPGRRNSKDFGHQIWGALEDGSGCPACWDWGSGFVGISFVIDGCSSPTFRRPSPTLTQLCTAHIFYNNGSPLVSLPAPPSRTSLSSS